MMKKLLLTFLVAFATIGAYAADTVTTFDLTDATKYKDADGNAYVVADHSSAALSIDIAAPLTMGNVVITNDNKTASTKTRFYYAKAAKTCDLRAYKPATLTFSLSGSTDKITKIVFTGYPAGTFDTGNFDAATKTWTGNADAVVMTMENGTTKVTKIEVTTGAAAAVQAPAFTPAAGMYFNDTTVTLACETAGAAIYYTTDGTTPTAASTAYTTPIALTADTTVINAIAVKGSDLSTVATARYILAVANPKFSPNGGTFYSAQNVDITSETKDAKIYYTLDGSTPDATSTAYTAPIAISEKTTLKAIAIKNGKSSRPATATYTFATPGTCSSITDFNALAADSVVKFTTPLTAVYQNAKELYVTDGTNYMLIYGDLAGKTYKNGDKVPAGFIGSMTNYAGQIEFKVVDAASFGDAIIGGAEIAPVVTTVSNIDESIITSYVKVNEATITSTVSGTKTNYRIADATASDFVTYPHFKDVTFPTDLTKKYDIVGFVGIYKSTTSTTVELYPILFTESSGVANVDAAAARVIAGAGQISVVGATRSIAVYSAAGALISTGAAQVSVAPGFYIVKVDGKVTKVIVK